LAPRSTLDVDEVRTDTLSKGPISTSGWKQQAQKVDS
jgi:hypothetical protein